MDIAIYFGDVVAVPRLARINGASGDISNFLSLILDIPHSSI